MAVACETDEPLDDDETMVVGGHSDASTTDQRDASTAGAANDAATNGPNGTTGGNAGGGNAGGSAAGGNAGGGNTGGGNTGGGADASSGSGGLDAGVSDASSGGVVIGPSMRRDGGPTRWDPDAAGPILNAEKQAACMTLAGNICTRLTDCEIMLTGLTEARRALVTDSCKNTFLRAHNCNRATATTSGFATCSEATKTRDCLAVFEDDFPTSCVDQITFQR